MAEYQAAPFLEHEAYLYSGDAEVKLQMMHISYERLGITNPPAPCCGSARTVRKICQYDTSDAIMKVRPSWLFATHVCECNVT